MLPSRCECGGRMPDPSPVYCETAELAVEAVALANGLGIPIEADLTSEPLDAAARAASLGKIAAALCTPMPEPASLVAALDGCSAVERVVLGAITERDEHARGIASDLGFTC